MAVLYRKYRPQTFEEVLNQKFIITTLKNQVISGAVSHAYLFMGSRGVGKTSVARILAKALNCKGAGGRSYESGVMNRVLANAAKKARWRDFASFEYHVAPSGEMLQIAAENKRGSVEMRLAQLVARCDVGHAIGEPEILEPGRLADVKVIDRMQVVIEARLRDFLRREAATILQAAIDQ